MSASKASWQVGEVACTEVDLKDTETKLFIKDLSGTTLALRVKTPKGVSSDLTPSDITDGVATWEYELTEAGDWDRHLIASGTWKTKRPLGKLTVGDD